MNRRDLLKFFGIGTVIAPIINGQVQTTLPAKLIAEPVIAPVELVKEMPNGIETHLYPLSNAFMEREIVELTVIVKRPNGQRIFISNGFIDKINVDVPMDHGMDWQFNLHSIPREHRKP